jgi:large subunit ribosomal protein L29
MKKNELKKLTKDQALKNIDKLKKDLFNFRFQKINSQITNPSKINETKKTIARLKTLLKGKLNV